VYSLRRAGASAEARCPKPRGQETKAAEGGWPSEGGGKTAGLGECARREGCGRRWRRRRLGARRAPWRNREGTSAALPGKVTALPAPSRIRLQGILRRPPSASRLPSGPPHSASRSRLKPGSPRPVPWRRPGSHHRAAGLRKDGRVRARRSGGGDCAASGEANRV
jgi:hypothetical protein